MERLPIPQEPDERFKMAWLFAQYDKGLIAFLSENGVNSIPLRNKVKKCIEANSGRECGAIRNLLRQTFGKKHSARKVVLGYRTSLAGWTREESDLPYPPNQQIMQLEAVSEDSLDAYLKELNRVTHDMYGSEGELSHLLKSPTEATTGKLELERNKIHVAAGAKANLEHRLREFIEVSDENALALIVHLLQKPTHESTSGEEIALTGRAYLDIFIACLGQLKDNAHLIGCLVQLMHEEVSHFGSESASAGRHAFTLLIEGFKKLGIVEEGNSKDFELSDPGQPREKCAFAYKMMLNDEALKVILIPAKYVPAALNSHRLVDAGQSPVLKAFGEHLQQNSSEVKLDEMSEMQDSLANHRSYALDFARIRATEIPSPEGTTVWLHYFYDEAMPEGYIGVELIVEDENGVQSSIAYVLDEQLELKSWPIRSGEDDASLIHPVIPKNTGALDLIKGQPRPTSSVEHMYLLEGDRLSQWLPEADQKKVDDALRYYFAKYAHRLLVTPRSEKNDAKPSSFNASVSKENGLNLSLEPYISETVISDSSEQGASRDHAQRTMTIFHRVAGFARRLRPGETASPEAIARAEKARVKLEPGYTFVRAHRRGRQMTGEPEPARVFKRK